MDVHLDIRFYLHEGINTYTCMEIGAHMKQVYKITNLKNLKSYIGISICAEQNHMDRFEKHMTGKGGVWIKKDLETGMATRDDFIIELLEEGEESDDWYRNLETYYIEFFDTLYPNGYNGNKGNYIVMTQEVIQKILETKSRNRAAGLHKRSGIPPGWSVWRYSNGELKWLPKDHVDVQTGKAVHMNFDPNCKTRMYLQEKENQRKKNNGYTDVQMAFFARMREISQTYVTNPNWIKGREKMRERHARKEFTETELDLYHNRRPNLVKESWKSLSTDARLERTSAGRALMNSKLTCEKCGIETNKGNYTRWHGPNCKHSLPKL